MKFVGLDPSILQSTKSPYLAAKQIHKQHISIFQRKEIRPHYLAYLRAHINQLHQLLRKIKDGISTRHALKEVRYLHLCSRNHFRSLTLPLLDFFTKRINVRTKRSNLKSLLRTALSSQSLLISARSPHISVAQCISQLPFSSRRALI